MSLINFLNPKLKPTVYSDAVCEDGYSATNLIADDDAVSRGFMAFAVCKPPVEIVFDFPKAIDLKVVKLWHSNGALRSTAFELHGKYQGIWERVANVRELGKGVDSVTFCYQSDYSSRSNSANSVEQQQSEKVFFFKTAHKILSTTNSLKIVIKATDRSPPVLRKVQVWGLPARSLDKADRELVKTIWNEIVNPFGDSRDRQQQSGQRSPSRYVPELNEQSSLKIPEEFLDTITWELMIFPTVLPSGHIVDQSTIDRHSEVEAKWGRLPSDPFTGLEFTSHRKAILNLPLKARIEKFLMENADHFKTVPRSLGSSRVRRSQNRHASQFASLACHSPLSNNNLAGTYSTLCNSYKRQKSKSTATATATLSSTGSLHSPPSKRARHSDAGVVVPSSASTRISASATITAASAADGTNSNPTSSSSSIDQAIQQALQRMTRFSRPPSEVKPASCISCKSLQFAYEIQTCKHLVCRECLFHLTQAQMCVCKISFHGADVERYHKL